MRFNLNLPRRVLLIVTLLSTIFACQTDPGKLGGTPIANKIAPDVLRLDPDKSGDISMIFWLYDANGVEAHRAYAYKNIPPGNYTLNYQTLNEELSIKVDNAEAVPLIDLPRTPANQKKLKKIAIPKAPEPKVEYKNQVYVWVSGDAGERNRIRFKINPTTPNLQVYYRIYHPDIKIVETKKVVYKRK